MWHRSARALLAAQAIKLPKPETKWRPMHRRPHRNNKTISIRRFISLAKEKNYESIQHP
jgi:hypothetical protein